jgi:hypothetical protein
VIPGEKHKEAVVFGDHYDTTYMEDIYDWEKRGSGARLSAPVCAPTSAAGISARPWWRKY